MTAIDPAILQRLRDELSPEELADRLQWYEIDAESMFGAFQAAISSSEPAAWHHAAERLAEAAAGVGAVAVEATARSQMGLAAIPADRDAVLARLETQIAESFTALRAAATA